MWMATQTGQVHLVPIMTIVSTPTLTHCNKRMTPSVVWSSDDPTNRIPNKTDLCRSCFESC